MATLRSDVQKLFPLKSTKDVLALFRKQMESDVPDLALISITTGLCFYIYNRLLAFSMLFEFISWVLWSNHAGLLIVHVCDTKYFVFEPIPFKYDVHNKTFCHSKNCFARKGTHFVDMNSVRWLIWNANPIPKFIYFSPFDRYDRKHSNQ